MVLRTVAMDRELMYTLSPHLKTPTSGHHATVARMQVEPCSTFSSTTQSARFVKQQYFTRAGTFPNTRDCLAKGTPRVLPRHQP